MYGELKIFSGRAHPALAEEICDHLNLAVGKVEAYNFSDGEIFCQIKENVRGSDVFVVQPMTRPVNGFSVLATQSASSTRPLCVVGISGAVLVRATCKKPRGTFAPRLRCSPRTRISQSSI